MVHFSYTLEHMPFQAHRFDGGDCCGDNVNHMFCKHCQCLEAAGEVDNEICIFQHVLGNGICEDYANIKECDFDGGDCCGNNVNTQLCSECQCLDQTPTTTTEAAGDIKLSHFLTGNNPWPLYLL